MFPSIFFRAFWYYYYYQNNNWYFLEYNITTTWRAKCLDNWELPTLWNVKNPPKDESCSWQCCFCKQLRTMGIPMAFRWFSSCSWTVPKAPTTIGITIALTSHNSAPVISRNSYVDDFAFSPFFINDHNIWPSVSYFLICLDCKVPKYFTFAIFQYWLWLMRESLIFTFNPKFFA